MGLELVEDALQLPAYRVKRGQFKGRRLARIQQGGREPLGLVLRNLFQGVRNAAHGHSSGPTSVDGRGKKIDQYELYGCAVSTGSRYSARTCHNGFRKTSRNPTDARLADSSATLRGVIQARPRTDNKS